MCEVRIYTGNENYVSTFVSYPNEQEYTNTLNMAHESAFVNIGGVVLRKNHIFRIEICEIKKEKIN